MWPNASGAGWWRLKDPANALNQTGKFECRYTNEQICPEILSWADIAITQSIVDKNQLAILYEWQQEHGLKWIMEHDDYPVLTKDNPFKLNYDMTNAGESITACLKVCDLVTVSTPYLKDLMKEFNPNIRVLPNYMNMERWDIRPKLRGENGKIRILWAGSVTHMEDMEIIVEPLTRLSKEFDNLEFYCIGDIRMSSVFKELRNAEFMLGTTFEAWPDKLRGVRADIGLAPLQDVLFTRCKSAIKVLEYGINEIPCVASPVEPYQKLADTGFPMYLAGTSDEWYRYIKELILSEELRRGIGRKAFKAVRKDFNLESHIKEWEKAYLSVL